MYRIMSLLTSVARTSSGARNATARTSAVTRSLSRGASGPGGAAGASDRLVRSAYTAHGTATIVKNSGEPSRAWVMASAMYAASVAAPPARIRFRKVRAYLVTHQAAGT